MSRSSARTAGHRFSRREAARRRGIIRRPITAVEGSRLITDMPRVEKERFLVEVTVKGEKGWKAIHMCGSMADAVPVADAVHNLSYLLDTPIAIRVREKRGKGLEG